MQHIGSPASVLPELLRFRGANHGMHPEDGQRLTSGTLLVAPPDLHMLVEGNRVRLRHGPKAWSSVRALREREMLMRRLASIAAATGDARQAAAGQAKADRLRQQIRQLQQFAEHAPPGTEADTAA